MATVDIENQRIIHVPTLDRNGPLTDRSLALATQRTVSIQDHSRPSARLPVEFRTMSVQLESGPAQQANNGKSGVKDLSDLDWHHVSIDEALRRLGASPQTGIDSPQAQRRAARYGPNQISPPPSRMLRKVLGWVFGGFGSLLLAASIVCFLAWKPLGEPAPQASNLALAVVLLVVVVLQAIFNAWQDFSTSRVMSSIQGMLPADVIVLRDGKQVTVPAAALVPGDIVQIALGQKVPADVKLIDVSGDIRFDRSVLTGESEPVSGRLEKTNDNILETKNIALQGTLCVSGSGRGLVFQTGDNTVFGRIAKLSSAAPTSMTTLQREILRFVVIIASLATMVAILIVILWAAWLRHSFPNYINTSGLLIDVVSVMVAFIPEGLPIAVTLSLAKVANTLSKHKVLCKSLSIVETLGSVNVLCSDKTGTLTQNKMHVEDAAIYDVTYSLSSLRDSLDSAPHSIIENQRQLATVAALCNAASFEGSPSDSNRKINGDATDSALLKFADFLLASVDAARSRWRHVHKMAFNSKTKYMLTLSETVPPTNNEGPLPAPLASWDSFAPGDLLLCVKGAPEILLDRCSHVISPGADKPTFLTYAARQRVVAIQEQWAAQGRRVLLLARRVVPRDALPKEIDPYSEDFNELIDGLNSDLIIVGMVGLIDPLKPDILDTVRTCRGAGIRFFVVTGDHPATAVAIAAQAGIITNPAAVHHASDLLEQSSFKDKEQADMTEPHDPSDPPQSIVITGAELETLSPEQEDILCSYQEIVFARTTPEQKLRIVRSMQARECVVAVTGDGVNDAPALRAADCGIAMGNGSDVAREAADMVLLEDFSAIVVALEYGRLVFDNLKKTTLYLLPAGSFSELMPIVLNVVLGVPQMLSNIQMILICVATDVLPALSMCFEPPESGLLSRPPRNIRKDRLANIRLLLHAYGFLGILESLCAMSMSFWYLQTKGIPFTSLAGKFGNYPPEFTNNPNLLYEAQSVYFFTLVVMQWGNLLSTRTRRSSIFQQPPTWGVNRMVIPSAICALLIGIFFCYVPVFHDIFQTSNIPAKHFFIPLTFALALLILDETRKLIVRTYPKSFLAWIAW